MKKIIVLSFLVPFFYLCYGQVKTTFYPNGKALEQVKHIHNQMRTNKIREFASFDVQKLLNEDNQKKDRDVPFRFGKAFETNITLTDGKWVDVENGRLWSMEFQSKNAYSINFVFDGFFLPDGAELYIANKSETVLYGPVTSKQNTKNGFMLTDLIEGDNVSIYIFEPENKKGLARLNIKRVVHAYRNLFLNKTNGSLDSSGSCNNDIACFPDWYIESDAIGLVLLSSGSELCSGSLLISANSSFPPYFLSAFHCIDTSENGNLSATEISNAENWMFKFQYKKVSCNGSSTTTGITYNGAQFRAGWNTSDFLLMELNNSLIENYNHSWLGWNRSGLTPTSGTGIHHPSGDVMKISFCNNSLLQTSYSSNTGGGHWRVNWNDGVTEPGSSGSPLLDQNKRVIGQLHGGQSACLSSDMRDWYGCFHLSWTGGGTNSTRLSNWLDPNNTGIITTNTCRYPFISGPTQVCPGENMTFTIENFPQGATVVWNQDTPITRVSPQGLNSCTFISSVVCDGAIYAHLTFNGISKTLSKVVKVGSGYYNSNDFTIQVYETTTGHIVNSEGPECLCENQTYDLVVVNNGYSQISNYTWNVPWTIISTDGNTIRINTGSNTEGCLDVSTINPCGYEENIAGTCLLRGFYCSGGYGFSYSLSPNPASDAVTINMNQTEATSASTLASVATNTKDETAFYSVKVIDSYSTIVYSGIKKSKQFTIPTSSLRNGIYAIIVSDKNKSYQRKLIVHH